MKQIKTNNLRYIRPCVTLLFCLLLSDLVVAENIPIFTPPVFTGNESSEEKGLIIFTATVKRRDSGYISAEIEGRAVTKNLRGEENTLLFRGSIYEKGKDSSQKSLLIFDAPSDIRGFGALVHLFPHAPIGQWVFLPELQRVKRVSGDAYASAFLGTAFYNEDLVVPLAERYSYRYIRDEEHEGLPCYVIDSFPLYEHSSYKRIRWWIDQKDFQFRKAEFYDLKDAHLKTLHFKNYSQYLGYWWRMSDIEMVNHQAGKTTSISYKWKLRAGLDEDDFSVNALKRLR